MSEAADETQAEPAAEAGGEFYCPACGARYSTPGICSLGHAATTVLPLGQEAEAEAGQDPAGGGTTDATATEPAPAAEPAPSGVITPDTAPAAEPAPTDSSSSVPPTDPSAAADAPPAADSADTPPAPSPLEQAQQNVAAAKQQIDSALAVIDDELAKLAQQQTG